MSEDFNRLIIKLIWALDLIIINFTIDSITEVDSGFFLFVPNDSSIFRPLEMRSKEKQWFDCFVCFI